MESLGRRQMATCVKCLLLSLSLFLIPSACTSQVYIVYLGANQIDDPELTTKSHRHLLSTVFSSEEDAEKSVLYSYKHGFSGFAAVLNATQAASLKGSKGVISVFRSKTLKLHTTRSWDFMGLTLESNVEEPLQLSYGDDTVVGILDTGVWPESHSFQETHNTGPIPPSWKGTCVKGDHFNPQTACNRKLIGARYYLKGFEHQHGHLNTTTNSEYRSPRDALGHGTHTASTAVGCVSDNATFLGFARGKARGGAPRARLAVYKICWRQDFDGKCTEADILAAFDDATRDGVDVISASFGFSPPLVPFFASAADIGSFHAAERGVSVVFSAGNDGPDPSLVQNVAPWSISVAASSVDRSFPTQILIDSNFSIVGESLITTQIKGRIASAINYFEDGVCQMENWIKSRPASGKIVLCFSTIGPISSSGVAQAAVRRANGSALIYAEPMTKQIADVDFIPTPDVSAPGVGILAAWPPNVSPTSLPSDRLSVNWNFQSGTSMACPHVAGVVALLKSAHPNWSPAAIKSALMTTAYNVDTSDDYILPGGSTAEGSNPFDVGAGHINPISAMNPGLVYDMKTKDYILFLCNIGYTQDQINNIVLPSSGTVPSCPKTRKTNSNINYPSISVPNLRSTVTIKRTVRNVARNPDAVYFASVVSPNGVEVTVWPRVLVFSCFQEENSYRVTLRPEKKSRGRFDFGEIVWSDGIHFVRSPLVVSVDNSDVVTSTDFNVSATSI